MLGALVDAGVPLDHLAETVAALKIGARLEARKVMRAGIAATKVDVLTAEPAHDHDHDHGKEHSHGHGHDHLHSHDHGHSHSHDHGEGHAHGEHRSLSTILRIIADAGLPAGLKERSARAFRLLGEAEAAIHSIPVETVHFHEVGALDTIVDIVGAAAGAEFLKVEKWLASPLNVGSGTVKCAHGTLPVPAPATLALLGDAPVYSGGEAMERVTPTGAAILRMLDVEYGSLPAMRVGGFGYGAGGRDTREQANVVRLLVGEAEGEEASAERIAILETVIDDSTPQVLAYVSERLLEAGAWDVYRIPVQMKKGRTGMQVTVLCAPDRVARLREMLFRETTTIGVHWRIEDKMALRREFAEVQTGWGAVRMKVARLASGAEANAAPEYEDCRRIAAEHDVPLKQVMSEAMRIYRTAHAGSREDAHGQG